MVDRASVAPKQKARQAAPLPDVALWAGPETNIGAIPAASKAAIASTVIPSTASVRMTVSTAFWGGGVAHAADPSS